MSKHAVEVTGLGKRYQLGTHSAYTGLREHLALKFSRGADAERTLRDVWALRDLSFEVPSGEVLGIIGRNGSGKSTLLKILARITEPTEGEARMRGRVGSLLEVGTGFHHELTGRENVFLNGAVLGMSRREIERRFDEIVEFSGVSRFLDVPIKRYSSGMKLRLAFAVAAHLEPEVIVVDEVLAVGDVEFQRRCIGKMSELQSSGRTVLFVSHDLGAVAQLCSRTLWLDAGRLHADGPTDEILAAYQRSFGSAGYTTVLDHGATGPVSLRSVRIVDPDGKEPSEIRRGEPFSVELRFAVSEPLPGLNASVYLVDVRGARLIDEALGDHPELGARMGGPGEYRAVLDLPGLLTAGEYAVGVWIGSAQEDFVDDHACRFELKPRPEDSSEATSRPRVLQGVGRWALESAG